MKTTLVVGMMLGGMGALGCSGGEGSGTTGVTGAASATATGTGTATATATAMGTATATPHKGAKSYETLYAQWLAAGKIEPLVKRIEEKQADGRKVREALAEVKAAAARFTKSPPKIEGALVEADWKKIGEGRAKVEAAAVTMARSTCDAWPDVAKALGGEESCAAKGELHYLAQGLSPKAPPDP